MKSLIEYINEEIDDHWEQDKKALRKQYEGNMPIIIPEKYKPKNEENLQDLLSWLGNSISIKKINDIWIKYRKELFNLKGPGYLFDPNDENKQSLLNTFCFGDHFGIGVRSEGFCLLLLDDKFKVKKGIISKIKYDYKYSFFYNLIELLKQKDLVWNYFCKGNTKYILSDNLSIDEIKDLKNHEKYESIEKKIIDIQNE